jgi:hypothetical protein
MQLTSDHAEAKLGKMQGDNYKFAAVLQQTRVQNDEKLSLIEKRNARRVQTLQTTLRRKDEAYAAQEKALLAWRAKAERVDVWFPNFAQYSDSALSQFLAADVAAKAKGEQGRGRGGRSGSGSGSGSGEDDEEEGGGEGNGDGGSAAERGKDGGASTATSFRFADEALNLDVRFQRFLLHAAHASCAAHLALLEQPPQPGKLHCNHNP